MPKSRGSRLVCFYCGKRSLVKYDGSMRKFDCTSCDATNWLDANGEITDPPAATTNEPVARPRTQYAISRASSPDPTASFASSSFTAPNALPSPSAEIFCPKCLKHQALFTACLAQYGSESDDDGDGDGEHAGPATRPASSSSSSSLASRPRKPQKDPIKSQRRYYAFRRNLEKLYPQVCEECEPKVIERVRQAGYTAKTDHLRRMMERSRASRSAAAGRTRTVLNTLDDLGRWAWWSALALQVAWHLTCVFDANALGAACQSLKCEGYAAWAARLQDATPPEKTLVWLAKVVAVPALAWNPQFVQVWRGFSRHILGLSQFYTLQCMVIMVRFVAWSVLGGGQAPEELTTSALVTAHAFIALFTGYMYMLALKAVTIDTTPLFGSSGKPVKTFPQGTSRTPIRKPASPRRQPRKTISDVLDEVLAAATPKRTEPELRPTFAESLPPLSAPGCVYRGEGSPSTRLGSLSLSGSHPQTPQRYQIAPNRRGGPTTPARDFEEMDWSPVHQLPRALGSTSNPQQRRAFGQAPTDPNSGPFWYKVPPAPVMPAHRDRNPKPRIIEQPVIKPPPGFFRSSPAVAPNSTEWQKGKDEKEKEKEKGITFTEPHFFAPDPTNQLADMLSTSFSLTLNDHPDGVGSATEDEGTDVQMHDAARDFVTQVIPTARHATAAQAILLFMLIMGWRHTAIALEGNGQIMGACLFVAGMISAHNLGVSRVWSHPNSNAGAAAANANATAKVEYALCALYMAEIGMVIHIGSKVHGGAEITECGTLGVGLFAVMGLARLLQAAAAV